MADSDGIIKVRNLEEALRILDGVSEALGIEGIDNLECEVKAVADYLRCINKAYTVEVVKAKQINMFAESCEDLPLFSVKS